jgi:hypothetical protein
MLVELSWNGTWVECDPGRGYKEGGERLYRFGSIGGWKRGRRGERGDK